LSFRAENESHSNGDESVEKELKINAFYLPKFRASLRNKLRMVCTPKLIDAKND
jgi:hypothetical protein